MTDIILLMDSYTEESRKLHSSLKLSGVEAEAVVLEEDGFLPEDVRSVFGEFMGDYSKKEGLGRPRYFNEVELPDFWEITGDSSGGKILYMTHERGRIFFSEPKMKRYVKTVDWYDERGVVRASDHYNQYGFIYARTIFNSKGEKVNRTFFTTEGGVAIEENFVTKAIVLTEGSSIRMFVSRMEFLKYYLGKMEMEKKKIFYNSLSTPFFLSEALPSSRQDDILFWQEPKRPDIPGNMRIIFDGRSSRTRRILVQNRAAYDALVSLGAPTEMLGRLGFVYDFKRQSGYAAEALICTNSDQIEKLNEIIEALPQVHFHICAVTEMSSKLMGRERYENVSLYPNVKPAVQKKLFEKCDLYFDFNYSNEILNSVFEAFLNNQLIFAFNETAHNRTYVSEGNVVPAADYQKIADVVGKVLEDRAEWDKMLEEQREYALSESKEAYERLQ